MKGIEVITGCMFSGKTTELFSRLKLVNAPVLLVKPIIDDRDTGNIISTHSGIELEAFRIHHLSEIFDQLDNVNVLGIDEAQFFPKTIINDLKYLSRMNVRIIIAGLNKDYLNKNFEVMRDIIDISDSTTVLHARCICGEKASFSYRKNQSLKDQILIGNKDVYEALCEICFEEKQKKLS